MSEPERFDTPLTVMVPPSFKKAIGRAAQKTMMSPSDYVRRTLLAQLVADGVTVRRNPSLRFAVPAPREQVEASPRP